MRKLLKRFAAAASAVVIGGVSCVTTWFSVPVSAAAGVGWLEWLEFQSLLQGIGVGGNNSDFADSVQDWIDGIGGAEMPREDYDGEWMTNYEYYNRVGWDEIIDWFDGLFSGDNSYSDVADVGTDVSGGGSLLSIGSDGHSFSVDNLYNSAISDDYHFSVSSPYGDCRLGFDHVLYWSDQTPDAYKPILDSAQKFIVCLSNSVYLVSVSDDILNVKPSNVWGGNFCYYNTGFSIVGNGTIYSSSYHYRGTRILDTKKSSLPYSDYDNFIDVMKRGYNIDVTPSNYDTLDDWFSHNPNYSFYDVPAGFIGPVYTYPAAQELYKSTGTAAGIRLDVQTKNGVPDVQAALDGAGVETVDDLVAGVAAGTVPMSKVFADAKVTPYVVADTTSGTVVTDLGVSATAAGVKSVGLTQDLAVPKDLSAAATYSIKGKTWDPEMSKYKLPLFEYFPFCLPWDIYQVLAAFSADPVAPVFDVPVGKILSGVRSVDASKAASVSAKIDFGDDNWSKVFEIIRILECAGIIVGLCLVAVYLIHGGR